MNDYAIWNNYFLAAAGGSAALTGLVFVSVSISLSRILEIPKITHRAINALSFLLLILFVSLVCLVPGQPVPVIGLEILAFSLVNSILVLILDRALTKSSPQQYKKFHLRYLFLDQIVTLPYFAAAIILICGSINGMYLLVPAFVLSFVRALIDAWVLLIEIHR